MTPKPSNVWTPERIEALLDLPLPELLWQAQQTHRAHFDPTDIQLSSLLSIKTGGCAEDCGYCPQSAHHDVGLKADKLGAYGIWGGLDPDERGRLGVGAVNVVAA